MLEISYVQDYFLHKIVLNKVVYNLVVTVYTYKHICSNYNNQYILGIKTVNFINVLVLDSWDYWANNKDDSGFAVFRMYDEVQPNSLWVSRHL